MKSFIYLYPIPELINKEIENHAWYNGGTDIFTQKYKLILNKCIDQRYRQKGFMINYALFDDSILSKVIDMHKEDKIIRVGLDFKTHNTKRSNGKYPYPNPDFILDQLGAIETIRITGFHMWDCVEKLAKRAFERGLNTLVDEDLTDFFSYLLPHKFKFGEYPSHDIKKRCGKYFKSFMEARKNKPWLFQNY